MHTAVNTRPNVVGPHDVYLLQNVDSTACLPASLLVFQRCHRCRSHLGTVKCKTMARRTMYWPNMSRDIENFVAKCSVCNNFRRHQTAEPLLPHPVPERPWQKVGVDIFSFKRKDYLLVVDYYSRGGEEEDGEEKGGGEGREWTGEGGEVEWGDT